MNVFVTFVRFVAFTYVLIFKVWGPHCARIMVLVPIKSGKTVYHFPNTITTFKAVQVTTT
ncbi:hypothetical protein ACVT98_22650 [Vibrio campbellii]